MSVGSYPAFQSKTPVLSYMNTALSAGLAGDYWVEVVPSQVWAAVLSTESLTEQVRKQQNRCSVRRVKSGGR